MTLLPYRVLANDVAAKFWTTGYGCKFSGLYGIQIFRPLIKTGSIFCLNLLPTPVQSTERCKRNFVILESFKLFFQHLKYKEILSVVQDRAVIANKILQLSRTLVETNMFVSSFNFFLFRRIESLV